MSWTKRLTNLFHVFTPLSSRTKAPCQPSLLSSRSWSKLSLTLINPSHSSHIEELDQSVFHGDQSLSQTHCPIIQDLSTLSDDYPPISDLEQSLELDQSTSQAKPSTLTSTCKVLDVHLSLCRGSNSKPVQRGSSDRDLKSYFKTCSSIQQPLSVANVQDHAFSWEVGKPFSQLDQSNSELPACSRPINQQILLSTDSSLTVAMELDQLPLMMTNPSPLCILLSSRSRACC